MTPATMSLLAELRGAGLSLEARAGGAVHVRPRELLTPERRQAIVTHKPAILAALDLERRIRAMGSRWHYSADDLTEALAGARTNPAGWLLACETDERRAALAERAGMEYPS